MVEFLAEMPRVALHTLGCKVNQYESEKIAEDFRSRGFDVVRFSDEADIYVVNTCTVTQTADNKSRQAARAAINRNPDAAVILTGCYAETSPDLLGRIDGVALVVGNKGKESLVDEVIARLPLRMGDRARGRKGETPRTRTRSLIKIQDGCDQFCAYCAVPFARPIMTSKPMEEVLSEARDLTDRGFKEIVLTGIRLGRYACGLTELVKALADIHGIERIRLSSIELSDIPAGLVESIAENTKVCRHLHIPLQSGDDGVLRRMKRPYTTTQFAAFVANVRSKAPGIGITTDIMVGFPGETAEEFENTCRFAEKVRFSRTHVFPYSARPRTEAATLKDDVSPTEKNRRKARIVKLAAECSQEFAEGLVGRTVQVLVEGKQRRANLSSGLTDNYVRVVFEGGRPGEMADVRVESADGGIAYGVMRNP